MDSPFFTSNAFENIFNDHPLNIFLGKRSDASCCLVIGEDVGCGGYSNKNDRALSARLVAFVVY